MPNRRPRSLWWPLVASLLVAAQGLQEPLENSNVDCDRPGPGAHAGDETCRQTAPGLGDEPPSTAVEPGATRPTHTAASTPPRQWWGKIKGAPTYGDFQMSQELIRKCSDKEEAFPMMDMPLSLTPENFRRIVLTQEDWNGDAHGYYMAKRWRPLWEKLRPYLPEHLGDVIDLDRSYPTCAVVGNSGNLLSTEFGRQIDSHGVIFRINRGPVKGYEESVGSKTHFRLLNKWEFSVRARDGKRHKHREKLPQDSNVTYLISRAPPALMGELIPQAIEHQRLQQTALRYVPLTKRVFFYANTLLSTYSDCMEKRGLSAGSFTSSTSGLLAVLVAMQLCDKVSVFGIGEEPLWPTTPYQYFHDRAEFFPRLAVSRNHNISMEGALINALAEAGLVNYRKAAGAAKAPPPVHSVPPRTSVDTHAAARRRRAKPSQIRVSIRHVPRRKTQT